MSRWLKSIVGYLLIVSVTMQMLPNRKYEQYVRLFTGFLLIILVLQPLLRIGSANSYLEEKISGFVEEQEELESRIGEAGAKFQDRTEELSTEPSEEIRIDPVTEVEVVLDD